MHIEHDIVFHFFAVTEPELPALPSFHHNVTELFSKVKHKPYLSEEITAKLNVQKEGTTSSMYKDRLLDKLRPYQLEGVKWMIAKEKG